MENYDWGKLGEKFIRAVVYSNKTEEQFKPKGNVEEIDFLIPYIRKIVDNPYDYSFIRKYRIEIESIIFSKDLKKAQSVYKKISHTRSVDSRNVMTNLRCLPASDKLLHTYAEALYDIVTGDKRMEYTSQYKVPMPINLKETDCSNISLYDFQKEAIYNLENDFLVQDKPSGMLIMPTGSGKTLTATYFLMKDMIPKGYQVIWLTHRHMLVDQAADAFVNNCNIIREANPALDRFTITCVSGEHSSIKRAEQSDDVIIISVQSGFRGLDYILNILADKVIIVIDEAHHAVAKSYKKIVGKIRQSRINAKLLGLTATPVRGNDKESQALFTIFDKHIVYNVAMNELIIKKILSEPQFQRVETNINFEPYISVDEEKLIQKYGELPPDVVARVAKSAERNSIILKQYLDHRKEYGKTLIFALNIEHCHTLRDDFKKAGVKADYVYSGREDNDRVIHDFMTDKLDVLININILTEGSDVPQIKTVFLTRPTQSEGLLVQMIGRGMRGPKAKGTVVANIVDFCDKWDTFNKWLNPNFIISEDDVELEDKEASKRNQVKYYPLQILSDIYSGISYKGDSSLSYVQGLPIGYYDCTREKEPDNQVLVFTGQEEGYKSLCNELIALKSLNVDLALEKYFSNFALPPYKRDIDQFLIYWYLMGKLPEFQPMPELKEFDVMEITKNLIDENVGIGDYEVRLRSIYSRKKEFIEKIYGSFDDFYDAVEDCRKNLRRRKERHIALFPREKLPYELQPIYDLKVLVKEVIDEMFEGEYGGIESINWTVEPQAKYFGIYYLGGRIQINSLLNSPSVPREVVKYVIYHELLHRDNMSHNKAFREKEHKYPNYVEWERFLDNTFNKFDFDRYND